MTFDGTQKEIGKGAQAKVLSYQGFAYKVYKESYPAEWISFEKKQQQAINKAGLSSVKYYDTDDSHIIKMDLLEGEQLENLFSYFAFLTAQPTSNNQILVRHLIVFYKMAFS